jgi:hypothetical protein
MYASRDGCHRVRPGPGRQVAHQGGGCPTWGGDYKYKRRAMWGPMLLGITACRLLCVVLTLIGCVAGCALMRTQWRTRCALCRYMKMYTPSNEG